MSKRIIGVYDTEHEAVHAVEDLKRQGFSSDDISVVAKDRNDSTFVADATDSKVEEGMATGAAAGGAVGGITGLLAGLGALAIPGIGPIVAAGPIAAALTGAAAGAGVGGIGGALVGMGIPEDEANRYDADINAGKILVMVDDDGTRRDNDGKFDDTYTGTATTYGTMDSVNGANRVTDPGFTDPPGAWDTPRSRYVSDSDGYATDNVRSYDDSVKHSMRDGWQDTKETVKEKYHDIKHEVKDAFDGNDHDHDDYRNSYRDSDTRQGTYSDNTSTGSYTDTDVSDTPVVDRTIRGRDYDVVSTDAPVANANVTDPTDPNLLFTDDEQRRLRGLKRDNKNYGDYDPTR